MEDKFRIEFNDFSAEAKEKINAALIAGLYEAIGEVQASAVDKTPTDLGKLRNDWKCIVDENNLTATLGNNNEYAIYHEFGTGEYSISEKGGRKGGWYVPEEKLSPKARRIMHKVKLKNGKVLYYTKGVRPKRMLFSAFSEKKNTVKRIMEEKLRNMN